jgi:hypothetical protein
MERGEIMEIIRPDWDSIDLYNGSYGAHLFEKERGLASIYILDGLDVGDDIRGKFRRKSSQGFVGHCLIVFYGTKRFYLEISPYSRKGKDDRLSTVWHQEVVFNCIGNDYANTNKYKFIGGLHGMFVAVSVEIEAQGFEIHIYGKDEPFPESLLPVTD